MLTNIMPTDPFNGESMGRGDSCRCIRSLAWERCIESNSFLSWQRICLQCRNPPVMQETPGSLPGFIPVSGRCPGEGNGNPLQYPCLENPTDRGAWRATVHAVTRVGHDLATKPPPPPRARASTAKAVGQWAVCMFGGGGVALRPGHARSQMVTKRPSKLSAWFS